MKSQLFKSAWKLVKEMGMTMSEALRTVWAAFKQTAEVSVSKSWNGNLSLVFSKSIGSARYSNASLTALMQRISEHRSFDTAGAAAYYGRGMYNGD